MLALFRLKSIMQSTSLLLSRFNTSTRAVVVVLSFFTFPVLGMGVQLSASAMRQIAALEAEKSSRTPVQQKIDSQLIYAEKMRRGLPIAEGVPAQRIDLDKDEKGRVVVDIDARVSDDLLLSIQTLGGNVVNSFPQFHSVRACLPMENIEKLATRPEVKFVQSAVRAMNNAVDSEGDYTHQAITARQIFGVNGSGFKVGVLSDSVDYLGNSQVAGLVTILPGQSGVPNSGEGTAMLEIVNDLAPGAQLYFATGLGGAANFANNIQQLRLAGCDIIVDDEFYYNESPFQDGVIAQAVNAVTASGALYFAAANNHGNKDAGTSGTWEGDFLDSGQQGIHNFGDTPYNAVIGPRPGPFQADLFWSDPLGAATNEYNIYVLDWTGTNIVASSTQFPTGTQDPYAYVPKVYTGEFIVIQKQSGTNRFLHLALSGGQLSISTQGSTRGHNCATNAFGVAATDATSSYPNPFTGGASNPVETFSSDGPRRVFYQADGKPITPGNFSSSGGAVRQKPDITAADNVTTDVPRFNPFPGTSAAGPHAAAIAALLKSYNRNLTPAQVRAILTGTALDIMAPGMDRDSGAGIVMALAALQKSPADLCIPPPAGLATWWPGDGNAADMVGSGSGILIGNTTFIAGKVGQAFNFDGLNGYVRSEAISVPVSNWSIAAWVFWKGLRSASSPPEQAIFYHGDSGGNGYGIIIPEQGDCLSFPNLCPHVGELVILYGGIGWYYSGVVLPTNSWNHVLLTRDTGALKLYINGQLAPPQSTVDPNPPTTDFFISKEYCFNGLIDEVMFFTNAISIDQARALFAVDSFGVCKPLVFTAVSAATNQAKLTLSGQAGKHLTIYASSNLVDWLSILAATNTLGTLSITDRAPVGLRSRFYRATAQ